MKRFKKSVLYILVACIILTVGGFTLSMTGCGTDDDTVTAAAYKYFAYTANNAAANINMWTIGATGALTAVDGAVNAASGSPVALVIDPAAKYLYVAATSASEINAYSINSVTGAVTSTAGNQPYKASSSPVNLAITPNGNYLYATAPTSSVINAWAINGATGVLTPTAGNQPFTASSTAVDIVITPNSSFAYVAVTTTRAINAYSIAAATGVLSTAGIDGQPFIASSSPTALAVHPAGGFLYAAAATSSVINAWSIAATGILTPTAGNQPFAASTTLNDIAIHPDGGFLYAAGSATTTAASARTIHAYAINSTTGVLSTSGIDGQPFLASSTPNSLSIDPSGRYLYAAASSSNIVNIFSINQTTGVLTQLTGNSNVSTSSTPQAIATTRRNQF